MGRLRSGQPRATLAVSERESVLHAFSGRLQVGVESQSLTALWIGLVHHYGQLARNLAAYEHIDSRSCPDLLARLGFLRQDSSRACISLLLAHRAQLQAHTLENSYGVRLAVLNYVRNLKRRNLLRNHYVYRGAAFDLGGSVG